MTQTSTQQRRKSAGIFILLVGIFAVMAIAASAQKSYNTTVMSPTSGMIMVKGQMYTLQFKITNTGMNAIPMGDTLMAGVTINGANAFMGGAVLMAPIAAGGSQTFNIPNFSYTGFTADNDNSNLCMNVLIMSNTNSGNSQNCQSIKLRLTAPTAVAEVGQNESVSIYPNPASDRLNIKTAVGTKGSFLLFDMNGRQVANLRIAGGDQQMATDDYPAGLYFYRMQSEDGTALQSGKLSIKH